MILLAIVATPPAMFVATFLYYALVKRAPVTPSQVRRAREHVERSAQAAGLTYAPTPRSAHAAAAAGTLSAFATGSYAGARMARNLHAVTTGRIAPRLANIAVGRSVVSKVWFR